VNNLSEGCDWAGLSHADVAMLHYARKLTVAASSIDENDITRLRELGFSDRAILEINLAAAYMNFVNRIAQGLGVELEASMQGFTR
jgi:alkylhydroperoxidase family enzyme